MDAKEYLQKAIIICLEHGNRGECNNKECPLHDLGCGIPEEEAKIDAAIEFVEHYEEKTYPFGRCNSCKKEFNSELLHEYQIKNCPWCGTEIKSV
jgi:DNA-directed RNA polymerase subunit RPC12/RpoP